jgi:prepilin-type N-terminal cleavage/methylation domain-containing protein
LSVLTAGTQRLKSKNTDSGFTLIEVMVALTLLAITVAFLMELFQSNLRASKRSEDYTQAIIIGTSEIEKALSTKLESGDATENIDIYKIERKIQLRSETEGFRVYEITVKVLWDNNLYEISSIKTEEVEEGEE